MSTTSPSKKVKLVGFQNFVRHNPMSDRFEVKKFHHIEFYCGDATNTCKRFQWGLGLNLVAKSDQSTNNHEAASYVAQSNDVKIVFTAPYALETEKAPDAKFPLPGFDMAFAHKFTQTHGLAVRALGIEVGDAKIAYEESVKNGGVGVLAPKTLTDAATGKSIVLSEVKLYGDVVIRWVSGDFDGPFVPGYETVESGPDVRLLVSIFICWMVYTLYVVERATCSPATYSTRLDATYTTAMLTCACSALCNSMDTTAQHRHPALRPHGRERAEAH